MERNSKVESKSLGVLGITQIILIVLKLLNLINIPWWQVFIPSYISLATLLIIIIFGLVLYIIFRDKY